MKKIVLTAGDRAGFLKTAPVCSALIQRGRLDPVLLLAGSGESDRENEKLASVFGLQDRIRTVQPDSSSGVKETASLMLAFGELLEKIEPEFVIPGGHDNISVAAVLAATRMGIPVVSLDAGLRSYDRGEMQELNRLIIDAVATVHFVSEHSGVYNLVNEGLPDENILFVGNTAIDSLVRVIRERDVSEMTGALGLEPKKFVTALFGQPFREETAANTELLGRVLESVAATTTVLLTCASGFEDELPASITGIEGLRIIPVPGYADLLDLLRDSAFVITDSDEFQPELTVMNVPCLTIRKTTARPSTIEVGTNVLVDWDETKLLEQVSEILSGHTHAKALIPEKWDGASAGRIAGILERVV